MDGKHRTPYAAQVFVQVPPGKFRGQPRIDPRAQHPGGLVAVVLLQAVDLARLLEYARGSADSLDRAVFDERLGGLRYQGATIGWVIRGAGNGHAAANAVSEGDKAFDFQLFPQA